MRGKRVLAGLLAGVMTIVPIQVRAEEVAYDIYTFTDMNNLTVSIPASLPLTYSGGVFTGKGNITVSGTNTSTTDYSVEIAVDSVNIDYTNQSDSSAVASGTVSFGTNGVESWTKDEVASSTGKDISVEVADFPEVEGVYSSNINYTINVNKDMRLADDLYFTKTINDSTMTCTITGMTDAGKTWLTSAIASDDVYAPDGTKDAGELIIPEKLSVDGKQYAVIGIGDNAFFQNTNIVRLLIGDNVKSIGKKAFYRCYSLTGLELGSNITSIGNSAFYQCTALTEELIIPDSVTTIDSYAFYQCKKMTGLSLGNSVKNIGSYAFCQCYDMIGNLVIPDSVITIGYQAFESTNFTELSLGKNIKTISNCAFEHCDGLKSIIFQDSITSINPFAFAYCYYLSDVYYLGTEADKTANLTINSDNNSYLLNATWHYLGDTQVFYEQDGLKYVLDISSKKADIMSFLDTTKTSITIPSTISYNGEDYIITEIPDNVFGARTDIKLESIIISEGITKIENRAFVSLDSLTNITIPKSVTTIEPYAFSGCSNLNSVFYLGTRDDKANITIGSDNDNLINATWYYVNDTQIIYEKDGLRYVLDTDSKKATLTGVSDTSVTEITIPSTISYDGVDYTLTEIPDNTFKGNTTLKSVTISEGVTKMGYGAFYGCSALETVVLPSTLSDMGSATDSGSGSQFWDCSSLTSVTIPEGITYLSRSMFGYCSSLKEVNLPSTMTEIGYQAFTYSGLTSIDIPENCTIDARAFRYCQSLSTVNMPDSVILAGTTSESDTNGRQFEYCTALTTVTVPAATTEIPGDAFLHCTSLVNATVPEGVSTIGWASFAECSKLQNINLPSTLTTVRDWAFNSDSVLSTVNYNGTSSDKSAISIASNGNSKLTNATWIYVGMKKLEYNGLNIVCNTISGEATITGLADSSVTDIVIPDSVTVDGVECKIVAIDGTPFKGNTQITSVSVGENITAIKAESFRGCTSLKNVKIKGGTSIGDNTFRDCKAIESVSLPEGLGTIGSGVFQDCQSMTTVNIPSTVTSIGSGAFWACHGLTEITIPEGVTVIRSNTFDSCSKLEIVNLPLSLETVEKYAFYSTALNTVNYAGTADNKNDISIASYNSPLTNATWNCITASTLSLRPIEELEILEEDGIEIIDSELLAAFPDIKVLILPKTIKCIEENAFSNNTVLETVKYAGSPSMWDDIDIAEQGNENLFNAELIFLEEDEVADTTESEEVITEYSISDGVCSIDESLLSSYADLEILNIPVSVTEISANAFINNSVLKTVNYAGTEEQWNDISISSEGNDNLFNAEITFAEEESTDEELTTEEETIEEEEIIEEDVTEEELTEDESLAGDNDEEINSDEEESTETSPIEIETDTVPIESEEPSCDSDDFVTPVKEETTEEEVSSSDEENPESESSESTEETQSESSEEVTEEA